MSTEEKHSWQTKFCPILTMAEIAGAAMQPAPEQRVVPSGLASALPMKKPETQAQPCQGHSCMFFVAFNNEAGKPNGDGACAITLQSTFASQQTTILGAIAAKITGLVPAQPVIPSKPH